MKVKRFFAKNMQAGLKEISQILGSEAVILNHHKVDGGVEIVAGVDDNLKTSISSKPIKHADLKLQQQSLELDDPAEIKISETNKKKWEKSDIIKNLKSKVADEKSISELLMELREQAQPEIDAQNEQDNQLTPIKKSKLESMMEQDPSFAISARSLQKKLARNFGEAQSKKPDLDVNYEESQYNRHKKTNHDIQQQEIKSNQSNNQSNNQIINQSKKELSESIEQMFAKNQTQQSDQWMKMQSEITELRSKLSDQQKQLETQNKKNTETQKTKPKEKHISKSHSEFNSKTHAYWHSSVNEFGLTEQYRNKVLNALKDHSQINWTLISKSLINQMSFLKQPICTQGGIFTFLGPTGAGKTTSIGKLASQFVMENGKSSVGIICMDHHQIGAQSSLKLISDILDVTFLSVSNDDYLTKALEKLKDKSLVLIDTGGSALAVNDYLEQFVLIENQDQIKHLICLPATASHFSLNQYQNLIQILPIHSAIITKLDESICAGAAMSCVLEQNLPTSYLTVGQNIPKDIHHASAKLIFNLIDEYKHISHIANNELVG
ncbi:hypothetical protein [Marinicellulosiphila megalodicopiae]|uniref:flagellar biosynthesis protein FlhF n=1 Tax=Marinicellulosiphila megalodicopiae TaxID=2724896 RepID=UPI003BB1E67A